jgi:hypothetical protein
MQRFTAGEVGSRWIWGEYNWAVFCGIAVLQDGLTKIEAEVLATALGGKLEGFREWRRLEIPAEQVEFNFREVAA